MNTVDIKQNWRRGQTEADGLFNSKLLMQLFDEKDISKFLESTQEFFREVPCWFTCMALLDESDTLPLNDEMRMLLACSAALEFTRHLNTQFEESLKNKELLGRPRSEFQQLRLYLADSLIRVQIMNGMWERALAAQGDRHKQIVLILFSYVKGYLYDESIHYEAGLSELAISQNLQKLQKQLQRLCAPVHILNSLIAEFDFSDNTQSYLTAGQKEWQKDCKLFCQAQISPHADHVDKYGELPENRLQKIISSGLISPFATSDGRGIEMALAIETLSAACANSSWLTYASAILTHKLVQVFGTDKHREKYRGLGDGDVIGCVAIAEEVGSNFAGYQTVITPNAGGYSLSGSKHKITNVTEAHMAMVYVKVNDEAGNVTGRSTYVIVDLDNLGVTRESIDTIGLRGISLGSIYFENVFISNEDVIELADIDTDEMLKAVEWGQLCQSCNCVGIAGSVLDEVLLFLKSRISNGVPLSELQSVRVKIGAMRVKLEAARSLTYKAAELMGQGRPAKDLVAMAKIFATESGIEICNTAMSLLGGHSLNTAFKTQRHWRDIQGSLAAGLTADCLRDSLVCFRVGIKNQWDHKKIDWSNFDSMGYKYA